MITLTCEDIPQSNIGNITNIQVAVPVLLLTGGETARVLPSIRADQVFAKSCDHYVSRLSFHQGETFRLLWGIHDSDDPVDDLCYTD